MPVGPLAVGLRFYRLNLIGFPVDGTNWLGWWLVELVSPFASTTQLAILLSRLVRRELMNGLGII